MKSPEYIVYQVLSRGPENQYILSYPLILHNDNAGRFGVICMWAKGHKIGKKLTKRLIRKIYINSLDDSRNLLNTSTGNKKDVFSLLNLEERRNKIYEMWGWRRLMYYQEL